MGPLIVVPGSDGVVGEFGLGWWAVARNATGKSGNERAGQCGRDFGLGCASAVSVGTGWQSLGR
jgi:hypothetical protein